MSQLAPPQRDPRLYTEAEVFDLFFAQLKPKV